MSLSHEHSSERPQDGNLIASRKQDLSLTIERREQSPHLILEVASISDCLAVLPWPRRSREDPV